MLKILSCLILRFKFIFFNQPAIFDKMGVNCSGCSCANRESELRTELEIQENQTTATARNNSKSKAGIPNDLLQKAKKYSSKIVMIQAM